MTDSGREDDQYAFKELPLKRSPKTYNKDSAEEKFWRKFQVQQSNRSIPPQESLNRG